MLSTWDVVLRRIAADAYQMDPVEWWVVDYGGVGDDAYLVVSDGDFRTRLQILRRPGSNGGSLHNTVRGRILAWAAGEGLTAQVMPALNCAQKLPIHFMENK